MRPLLSERFVVLGLDGKTTRQLLVFFLSSLPSEDMRLDEENPIKRRLVNP